jgi:hypothetical protein
VDITEGYVGSMKKLQKFVEWKFNKKWIQLYTFFLFNKLQTSTLN